MSNRYPIADSVGPNEPDTYPDGTPLVPGDSLADNPQGGSSGDPPDAQGGAGSGHPGGDVLMKRSDEFLGDADRYLFDFQECTARKGWAQVDTRQDAAYFGIWANPTTLEVVTFAEGDLTRLTMESPSGFREWLASVPDLIGIDPGFNADLKRAFRALGMGHLLH